MEGGARRPIAAAHPAWVGGVWLGRLRAVGKGLGRRLLYGCDSEGRNEGEASQKLTGRLLTESRYTLLMESRYALLAEPLYALLISAVTCKERVGVAGLVDNLVD